MGKPTPSLTKPPTDTALRAARRRKKSPEVERETPPGNPSRVIQWRNGTEVRRLSFYLPPDLAMKFRIHCAGLDNKFSEAMRDIVCRELGEDPRDYDH